MATTVIPGDKDILVATTSTSPYWFATVEEAIAFANSTCLECAVFTPDDDYTTPVISQF